LLGKLFIISAPSGAGKTTLVTKIISALKSQIPIERVITYTTKRPRSGEKNGHDYHFVSRDQFEHFLANNFFMEYSNAYTDYYGSPASVIDGIKRGTSYVLIVDRVGAQKIVKKIPDAVKIWIDAPSLAELEKRLMKRGTDSKDQIKRRLLRAQEEIALEKESPFYDHHIINHNVTQAVCELEGIISGVTEQKAGKNHSKSNNQKWLDRAF
jgi:guanylate kinase